MSTSDIFKKKHDSEEILESESKVKKSQLKLEKSDVTNRDTSVKDEETNIMKSDKIKMKSLKNIKIGAMMTWWYKYDIQTAGAVRSSSSDNKSKHSYLMKINFTVVQKKAVIKYLSNSATEKAQLKWEVR